MENYERAIRHHCSRYVLRRKTHVEVGNGLAGVQCSSNHLCQLAGTDTVAHASVEQVGEGRDNTTEDECDNVRPPGEGSVTLDDDDQT